jgi:PAS domain S-box-containing protein
MSDYSYAVRVENGRAVELEWMIGAFRRITGYGSDELAPGMERFVHADDLARVESAYRKLSPGGAEELEYRIHTKRGDVRWIRERVKLVRDAESGALRLYAAAHDVTDRKLAEEQRHRLEERVFEAQKLESLGVMAGGIAHDFNNLLLVVLGNAAVVLSELPPDSPLRARVERVRKAAEVAAALTGQMLTYAGGASFERKPLDLSRAVEEMSDLLHSAAPRAELAIDCPPGLPWIEAEATQVRQVLLNLVTNAAESLGARGGSIRVRTGRLRAERALLAEALPSGSCAEGDCVLLEVVDDGDGMDDATRARIFEPFFTTKFQGRGLGLAAVLGIVRGHRGAILLDSRPGQGTRFRVLFPAVAAERVGAADSQAGLPPAEVAAPVSGAAVLLVDDDEPVREVTGEFLRRAGFRVLEAGGGREALALFGERGEGIGVVLLDVVMPDLGGDELLTALRERRPDVRVLLWSGHPEDAARARVGDAGPAGFVRKPCEPGELVARVRAALTPAAEPGTRGTP